MTVSNQLMIAAQEASGYVERLPEPASLEHRLRTAMEATYGHWVCTDDTEQFLAACEAVYRTANDDEKLRIEVELRQLRRISTVLGALQAGVEVNLEAEAKKSLSEREEVEPLRLQRLWNEVKRAA